jgi:hypothetical protein
MRGHEPVRSLTTLLNRFKIESFQYSTAKGAAVASTEQADKQSPAIDRAESSVRSP